MTLWKPYYKGPVDNPIFFNRDGTFHCGDPADWEKMHGHIQGLINELNGIIVILNEHGEVAMKGIVLKEKKETTSIGGFDVVAIPV